MNKVQQEIEAMQACWTRLRALSPESRNAVVLWLFDHVDDEVEGSVDGWSVHMHSLGERKINVIKTLRAHIDGLGLREAKVLAESAPCDVATGLTTEFAERLAQALREAGAEVVMR